jgi:hypothetical protein
LRGLTKYFFPPAREVQGDRITYRTHWIALLRRAWLPFGLLIVTLLSALAWYSRAGPFGGLPDEVWPFWLVASLGFGGWSLWVFDDWRNDLYIVTSSRLIDIQRTPLLLRETRKEATLDRVQTLKADIPSALGRLLRYGTVTIGVPGASFEFKNLRDPSLIREEISKKVDQYKGMQAQIAQRERKAELADYFAVYDQLRQGYRSAAQPSPSEQSDHGGS